MMNSVSNRLDIQGGGWGVKVKADLGYVAKETETVDAVTAILTDYRSHYYYSVTPRQLEFEEELQYLKTWGPEKWFEEFGYFFIVGYTTGSSFEGR
jgi:hypothetical protein